MKGLNMKAITTRFHGPSNVKGSRVSAFDMDGNRVILSWDHSLNSEDNHEKAAYALCDKMNWRPCKLLGGGVRDGMVFVFARVGPHFGRQQVAA